MSRPWARIATSAPATSAWATATCNRSWMGQPAVSQSARGLGAMSGLSRKKVATLAHMRLTTTLCVACASAAWNSRCASRQAEGGRLRRQDRLAGGQGAPQAGDVRRRGALRRQAGDQGLDRAAGLDHVQQRPVVRDEQEHVRIVQPAAGGPGDDRAATLTHVDELQGLQGADGLSDGGAADAGQAHQLGLRGQQVAGADGAAAQEGDDLGDDGSAGGRPGDALQQGGLRRREGHSGRLRGDRIGRIGWCT